MARFYSLQSIAKLISTASLRPISCGNYNAKILWVKNPTTCKKPPSRYFSQNVQNVEFLENFARECLRKADAVCFDVDSTVISEEGIDVLAEYCGAGDQVAELTRRAMGGSMLFQDAIKARLDLIKPTRQTVADCLERHPPSLSPGVLNLIQMLHDRGTDVYFVSGGFRLMIQPVADKVGVPHSRIYANTLLFHDDGSFRDFDRTEPTSHSGGKAEVIKQLKDRKGYKNVVMVGDGVTDMQARPPADAFIGYGGVAQRQAVMEGADWFVTDFKDLIIEISS